MKNYLIDTTFATLPNEVVIHQKIFVLTFSISPLFLLRAERVILTVTEFSSPCRRRAIRFGCRGLNEISSSGRGKRLALPFSVEISEESSTDGQPAEPCGAERDAQVKGHIRERERERDTCRGLRMPASGSINDLLCLPTTS